LNRCEVNKLNK